MRSKGWLAFVMLALGTGLLVAAQLAGAAPAKSDQVIRVGTPGASVQIDPQVAYITTAWWLEDATAAKLYDLSAAGMLVPQAASGFTVANRGRTYTFTIRKGFRFSDGTPVTAKSFAYAIDRVANKELASPGAQFITDPNGVNIVGAAKVNAGQAQHVSGVVAKGLKLVIRLVKPDPDFVATLTMPFFQATSTTLPLNQEVLGAYPSAGRYAFTHNDINVLTSIRRNPFWTTGPGRTAPRHPEGLDVVWNQDPNTLVAKVQAGQLDEDSDIPAVQRQALVDQYGINKSRFWVKAQPCIGLVVFNNQNHLFKGNIRLRQAVNFALDRTYYVGAVGPFAGRPWSHLLPPVVLGSSSKQPYPKHANIAKAKGLARGHLRGGKITVYYRASGTIFPSQAQVVHDDLIQLGFKSDNITMKGFTGGDIYTAMGVHGSPADMGVSFGFCGDSFGANVLDPAGFIGGFLDPASPLAVRNAGYRNRFLAAQRLHGRARFRALGKLDVDLMRNLAPAAAMRTYDSQFLFSARVDPNTLRYQPAYGNWSIGALALK